MSKKKRSVSPARPDARVELEQKMLAWRGEAWTKAALAVFVLFCALILYLGMRPGGRGPIWIYVFGRFWISGLALVVLGWGVATGLRRRPFVRAERMRALVALTLVIATANYPIPYPSSHEGHPSAVEFHLPFEGEWTVVWGGEDTSTNRLAVLYPDRRYGLHLIVTEEGRSRRGELEGPEDYLVFDRPVLAPAAGRIVRVHDGEADRGAGDARGEEALGNHLVLEVAPEEYLFICGLRQGSLLVEEGRAVERGDPLARVGSSGWSPFTTEPHLAIHLQDTPEAFWGEALPWRFHDYLADGQRVERGIPLGGVSPSGGRIGQRVRPVIPG